MSFTTPFVGEPLWGPDLNSSLAYLDTNKADNSVIATIMQQISLLQQEIYGLLNPESYVFTYDNGTPGTDIVPGMYGVEYTQGAVEFSTAAAIHGPVGLARAYGVKGNFTYSNPGITVSSGSEYYCITEAAQNDCPLMNFANSTDSTFTGGQVQARTGGNLAIVSPAGAVSPLTTKTWSVNVPFRMDWEQSFDGMNQSLSVNFFYGANMEGTLPDDSISLTYASEVPDQITYLDSSSTDVWGVNFDTLRLTNQLTWYAPYNPGGAGYILFNFTDGTLTDGADGVVAVTGSPTPSTAQVPPNHPPGPPNGSGVPTTYSIHVGNNDNWTYETLSSTSETGSLYIYVDDSGNGNNTKLINWEASQGAAPGETQGSLQLNQTSGGDWHLTLVDAAGSNVNQGSLNISESAPAWVRIDWQRTWDGTDTMFVDVKTFGPLNGCESVGPADNEFTATWSNATSAPEYIAFGTGNAQDWDFYVATIQLWDSIEQWPYPFGIAVYPSLPTGNELWVGDVSQTEAMASFYSGGTSDSPTTPEYSSLGLWVSEDSGMSSPVVTIDAADVNQYGWILFDQVTGLTANTQYYAQAFNGSTGVGPVIPFTTTQTEGTGSYTQVGVAGCKENNPALSIAFTDMTTAMDSETVPNIAGGTLTAPAWNPTRFMNINDFSYPGLLSTDIATHYYNWALNITDPAHMIATHAGSLAYVISDHDSNGGSTRAGDAPNFNDPVTATGITAWQNAVPAFWVDTRNRSRHRSWVDGTVRHVLLDTRSLDRTDTINDIYYEGTSDDIVINASNPPGGISASQTPLSDYPNMDSGGTNRHSMLGSPYSTVPAPTPTQLEWLLGEIDDAAANNEFLAIWTDPAWVGLITAYEVNVVNKTANGKGNGGCDATVSDKWPAYVYERDYISDYIASKLMGSNGFVNAAVWSSDTHALQIDDGTNERNGIAAFVCGPYSQNLHAHFQVYPNPNAAYPLSYNNVTYQYPWGWYGYKYTYPVGTFNSTTGQETDGVPDNPPYGPGNGGGSYREAGQYARVTFDGTTTTGELNLTVVMRDTTTSAALSGHGGVSGGPPLNGSAPCSVMAFQRTYIL